MAELRALSLCISSLVLASCNGPPVGVRHIGARQAAVEASASALTGTRASESSREVLGRFGLLAAFEEQPEETLAKLHAIATREHGRDYLFALAELSHLHASAAGSKAHFLAAVAYAYWYLFSPSAGGAHDPYDPRFRLACDLYNQALSKLLTEDDGDVIPQAGDTPLPFGTVELRVSRDGFPWSEAEYPRFIPSYDFSVRGLRGRYRNRGLGAPLIAVRSRVEMEESRRRDLAAPGAKVAATAFLRLPSEPCLTLGARIPATLELYATWKTLETTVENARVPLEADFTAPIAHALEDSKIWELELSAFFSGIDRSQLCGLYRLEPYTPGKIPVVFVHGTASSPARWAEMFNGLLGYRDLRERYQFWFFFYTTGNPIPYSAAQLRESLLDIVHNADPEGKDPALRQMVLIGHSQGGLLTRLSLFDSGDSFWKSFSTKPLEDLDLTDTERELVRRTFFFQRLPFVRRAVFIATPHHGSFVAGGWLGRLAVSFLTLPGDILDVSSSFFLRNEAAIVKGVAREAPSSVRGMGPNSPFVKYLASMPIPDDVKTHSIIAVRGRRRVQDDNDGVVAYESAHLEGTVSELVLTSRHSCQAHPLAVVEVRRILLEHLAELPKP